MEQALRRDERDGRPGSSQGPPATGELCLSDSGKGSGWGAVTGPFLPRELRGEAASRQHGRMKGEVVIMPRRKKCKNNAEGRQKPDLCLTLTSQHMGYF